MRTAAILMLAILAGPAAVAAPELTPKQTALAAGDWRKAAQLGASAAEVVRALQVKGQFADADPEDAVVTIGADNAVEVVEIKPLPPLPADVAGAHTRGLSGSGFAFTAPSGSIVLYPADADTFDKQARDKRAR